MNDTMTATADTKITVKIGDVFKSSWGYDQTNVDFYQVTGLTSKGVKVRSIGGNETTTGMMSGETTPVRDAFNGEEKFHVLKFYGCEAYFRINSYSSAYITTWDKKHYCSWGH